MTTDATDGYAKPAVYMPGPRTRRALAELASAASLDAFKRLLGYLPADRKREAGPDR